MPKTPRAKSKPRTHLEVSRRGGAANTPAQNAARKRNAQLAGRPRRVCTACGERVRGGHVDRRVDAKCGGRSWRWQRKNDPPAGGPTEQMASDALDAVAAALHHVGAEPTLQTLSAIAAIVRATGRAVK